MSAAAAAASTRLTATRSAMTLGPQTLGLTLDMDQMCVFLLAARGILSRGRNGGRETTRGMSARNSISRGQARGTTNSIDRRSMQTALIDDQSRRKGSFLANGPDMMPEGRGCRTRQRGVGAGAGVAQEQAQASHITHKAFSIGHRRWNPCGFCVWSQRPDHGRTHLAPTEWQTDGDTFPSATR